MKKGNHKKNSVVLLIALLVAVFQTLPVQAFSDVWSDHEVQFFDPSACDPSGGDTTGTTTTPPTDASARAAADTSPSDSSLTDDQKISATFNIGFNASIPKATILSIVTKYKPAGIFILGTTDAKGDGFTKSFFDSLEQAAGHKLIIASDEEGVFKRYKYSFDFPKAKEISGMSDSQVTALGKKVGQALTQNGVNTDLAPVLDVATSNSGVVAGTAGRAFSDDETVVTKKAGAFADGLNSGGVKPVYKHFPGLGSTNGNSDAGSVTSPSLDQLKLKDLKPYQALLGKHGGGVMLDNAHVPGLTSAGEVASISKDAVELLRDSYHYTGLITTDDLKAGGVPVSLPQAISKSLKAGVDMPLFAYTSESDIDSAVSAAKSAGVDTASARSNIQSFISGNGGTSSPVVNGTAGPCGGCDTGSSATSPSGSDNVEITVNFFMQQGLSPAQAAGVTANFMWETGGGQTVNPVIAGPSPAGKPVWGIAQWTPPTPYINDKASNGITGEDKDLITQLKVVWAQMEGKGTYNGGQSIVPGLKQIDNAGEAANYFRENFERCDTSNDSCTTKRVQTANDLAQKIGNGNVGSGSNAVCSSGTAAEQGSVDAAVQAAKKLSAMKVGYVWGGSHGAGQIKTADSAELRQQGMDCSSSVSWVLHQTGMLTGGNALDSTALMSWGESGKGTGMTVWASADHAFIEFNVPGLGHYRLDTSQNGASIPSTTPHATGPGPRFVQWGGRDTSGFTPRHWPGT